MTAQRRIPHPEMSYKDALELGNTGKFPREEQAGTQARARFTLVQNRRV